MGEGKVRGWGMGGPALGGVHKYYIIHLIG
jgi:hypothetical protein